MTASAVARRSAMCDPLRDLRWRRTIQKCQILIGLPEMKLVPIFIAVFLAQAPPSGSGGLHLPYYDWNACPFECCTYRTWTANAAVKVLRERRANSSVAVELRPGQSVQAFTGVVVTTRAGEMRAVREGSVGESKFRVGAGDVIRILRPEGEGFWKIWFNGKTDTEELLNLHDLPRDSILRVVSAPEITWWVKVRTNDGRVGWTTAIDQFDGKDGCG